VRDGDEWLINGQKIFTSLATDADYVWLAVRTDPEASKHKGISMIIVPTATPGFKAVPIQNFGIFNTNYTFYEDVRVPYDNVVGGENMGWNLIMEQLNHERVTLCSSGIMERALDDVRRYQDTEVAGAGRLWTSPVQHNLACPRPARRAALAGRWRARRTGSNPTPPPSSVSVRHRVHEEAAPAEILGCSLHDGSPARAARTHAIPRGLHVLTSAAAPTSCSAT
jgi:alkylation response protein AidB-like acyl-CoA dehydrogenase